MKKLIYNMDEYKILKSLLLKDNPKQSKEIETFMQNEDKETYNNFTFTLKFEDHGMCQEFTNNKTGDKFYQSSMLPVLVREIYHKLFNKLYWKYCN